jgi:hypothetical protein
MTLIGNSKGKLRVQRQVEDYALRGVEFEAMGFLTFIVETYERGRSEEKKDEEDNYLSTNKSGHYLDGHPNAKTHYRLCRGENHNYLPNIVGPWLPRGDGEEDTKSYYYAAMLAFLKPWRDLRELIDNCGSWEMAFNQFMENANQRDRDVIAGCQYYYDSRNVVGGEERNEEENDNVNEYHPEVDQVNVSIDDEGESSLVSVSFFLF